MTFVSLHRAKLSHTARRKSPDCHSGIGAPIPVSLTLTLCAWSPCLHLVEDCRENLLRIFQFQRESGDSQIRQFCSQGVEFHRVFFRRQKAVCSGAAGLAAKPPYVGLGVSMMIAKGVMTGDVDAGAFKIAQKTLRPGNRQAMDAASRLPLEDNPAAQREEEPRS